MRVRGKFGEEAALLARRIDVRFENIKPGHASFDYTALLACSLLNEITSRRDQQIDFLVHTFVY